MNRDILRKRSERCWGCPGCRCIEGYGRPSRPKWSVRIESEYREGILLEDKIKDLFGLKEVLIVENVGDPEKTMEYIARGRRKS